MPPSCRLVLNAVICGMLAVPSMAGAAARRGCAPVTTHRSACATRPRVDTHSARVWARSAILRGSVNPRGGVTRYRFEYARLPGPWHVTHRRVTPAGGGWRGTQFTLRGLRPGTRYRYRLIAVNRYGTTYGRVRALTIKLAAPGASPASTRSMLWGAELGTQFTGSQPPWDMTPVSDFQQSVGKAPGILPFNIPFTDCSSQCGWYWFPTEQMDAIRQYGSIPMLNWSSMSSPIHPTEPNFRLSEVINGTFDAYLRTFAEAAKAWGHPFFLRFNWEMNGNWFPWGEGGNGNQPGESAAAWRHVHDIFTSVGATNVNWVWCPSVTTVNATIPLHELYPGAAYVDWTCMDGYNWGPSGPHGWQSFGQVFSPTYAKIEAIAPSKPMMIGEVGATDQGGSKPAWISDMFSQLATGFQGIRGLLWFDVRYPGLDWSVESSLAAQHAFATGVSGPDYASNDNAALDTPAITPP